MKLKRLELNGFKSFSEKTVVSFPKGISGVVGPNGCGKSNIVDAIKWVMGEQSPKQLRGKGMEDVIFAGSNGKSSVGMAEVSLVLDNDNGSIPKEYADYSEVVITRRLFRDGESEYAINNKPCRLKDITHLFMDTGVGSKAYSVIEQGRIGAIIDSKPEDRRHWIEEAAGISKYKSQKNETLRKLDLTQQNLLRVSDVIAEVKRQMNSLYRQAKKAERFKEIRKQSKEIELVLLVKEYQTWQEEKEQKEEKLLRQQSQTGELREECHSQEASLDLLQGELSALEKRLKEKQEQFYRQKGDLEKQETLMEQYQNEWKSLEIEALELEKELQEIRQWLEENIYKEEQLAEEVRSFSQTLAREEERVRDREQSVGEAKKSLTQAQGEGERVKDVLVTRLTELTQVRNQRSGLVKLREDRQRRSVRQKEEKAQIVSRLDFLQSSVKENTYRLSGEKEALADVKERIAQSRHQKNELEFSRKKIEEDLRDLEQNLKQDQSQIKNLQALAESRQTYDHGVRALLQADWTGVTTEDPSFQQVFADGLETEPGYETAVEAALGGSLQALMIRDTSCALEGIRYLKDRNQGRATFLPLNIETASDGTRARIWEEKGLIPLISKVTAQAEIKTWVEFLLGNFILVEDLAQGITLWKENVGRVSVVTPSGDLIDSRGIISGGGASAPESGILFQKNLVHKLEEKLGDWEGKITRTEEELGRMVQSLEKKDREIQSLEEEIQKKERQVLELEKQLIGRQEESKPMQRRLQLLDMEEEENRIQERDDLAEEQQLCSQEETLNHEIDGLRNDIQQREEAVGVLAAELEKERQRLTEVYAQVSALKEKGGHIGREWETIKGAISERRSRQARLEEKIRVGREHQSQLKQKSQSGAAAVQSLLTVVEELESQIEAENQGWEKMIKQKEEGETALKESRGVLSEAEQVENELRMDLAQMAMKIDHIVELIREQTTVPTEEWIASFLKGDEALENLKDKKRELRDKLEQLGEVNLTALEEYNAFKERYDFYHTQEEDLVKSMDSLKRAIQKINSTSRELFLSTFKVIQEKMNEVFPLLFGGGTARLSLTDEEDPLEAGVDIMVHPPGKRVTSMSLLSGGEKALTALALLFATYLVKPSPFCLLDEIDAFLDEANVERFKSLVRNIVRDSQIILITHNRRIMEMADTLYGVTMEQPGVSKLVSVQLDTIQ